MIDPRAGSVSSSEVAYGSAFQVFTPNAANISSVVLIRPGAPTHAFDMEQRLIKLNYVAGASALDVTAPPNGNIAPPGYYMLFLINNNGVPSVAPFVLLNSSPPPPPPNPTSITPTSGSTGGGTPVTITGTGFLAGARPAIAGWHPAHGCPGYARQVHRPPAAA